MLWGPPETGVDVGVLVRRKPRLALDLGLGQHLIAVGESSVTLLTLSLHHY